MSYCGIETDVLDCGCTWDHGQTFPCRGHRAAEESRAGVAMPYGCACLYRKDGDWTPCENGWWAPCQNPARPRG